MSVAAALAPRDIEFLVPRAYAPLLKPARYKGVSGGRGSAKSHFFAEALIEESLHTETRAVCIREVQKSLAQSSKLLLEDKIKRKKLSGDFIIRDTRIEGPHNSLFIFNGMQDHTADSIKSLEGFRIAWVEEAQSLSQRSLDLLRPTIRAEDSELWFSWNPRRATDPIDKLLRGQGGPPPGAVVVHTTYRDNPFFPDVLRREMEWDRTRDADKYAHIWLGEYERHNEARVFKNWRVEYFDTPSNAQFLFGGDWGFSTDPTTLVRMFIVGKTLYIDAEVYRVGCEIDHTPALFDSLACKQQHVHAHLTDPLDPTSCECDRMARQYEIVTDSARPETISYMQRHGYPRTTGAKKGPNSIKEGVEFLKTYDIVIHPRCTHAADEFTLYSFKQHHLTGEIIPELEDKKNHIIDPCRYATEKVRNPIVDFVTW